MPRPILFAFLGWSLLLPLPACQGRLASQSAGKAAGKAARQAASQAATKPAQRSKPRSRRSWESLEQGGRTRRFLLVAPLGLRRDERRPLVLLFHGAGSKPETILRSSGFAALATRERFFLAVPEGTPKHPRRRARFFGNPRTWNDGSGRPSLGAVQQKVDDVAFVRRLITNLQRTLPIDPKRVYASGFSNGASFTWLLGRKLGDRIAAIAPVAGADFSKGSPKLPLPALFYATGKKDPLNPIAGGPIRILGKPAGTKPAVAQELDRWRLALGLPKKPKVLQGKGPIRVLSWRAPGGATEIRLLTIEGHGHIWPGVRSILPKRIIGPSNPATEKLNFADLVWSFFRSHPRP